MRRSGYCFYAVIFAYLILLTGCGDVGLDEAGYLNRAKEQYQKADYRAAVIDLKNTLQANPDNAEARYLLGKIYLETGQGVAAEIELGKARRAGSTNPDLDVLMGQTLLMQGQFERLLNEIQERPDISSDVNSRLMALRGEAYLALDNREAAQQAFNKAVKLDQTSLYGTLGLVRLAMINRDFQQAHSLLTRASGMKKDPAQVQLLQGDLALVEMKFADAEQAYQQVASSANQGSVLTIDQAKAMLGLIRVRIAEGNDKEALSSVEALRQANFKAPLLSYFEGLIEYRQGNYDKALEHLTEVEKSASKFAPNLFLTGATYFAAGQFGQAENYLERYVTAVPDDRSGKKMLAAVRVRLNQPEQALELLKPMINQAEDDAQLLAMAGNAALMAGDYGQGTAYLRRATNADVVGSDSAALHEQLASAYLFGREPDKAIQELKASIGKDSGRFRSAALLVLAHLENKDVSAAQKQAEETVQQFPDEPGAYHLLGNVYLFSGDIDNAVKQFRKAVEIKADFEPSLQNLALLAVRSGDFSQARQYYQQILKTNPASSKAMIGLAQIEARNNNSEAAAGWLDKARKTNARDLNARLLLAQIRLQEGKLTEVESLIDEMNDISPDNEQVMSLQAETAVRESRFQDALAIYQKLVSKMPSDAALQVNLAGVQVQLSQIDKAKQTLQKVVESQPEYYPATALLAFLEQKSGNQQAANSLVSGYQHRRPDSPMGYILEGDLLMAQARYAEAGKAYAVASSKNNSSQLVEKRYRALKLGGDGNMARDVLTQWLAQHPDDIGNTMLLADDHMISGENMAAIKLYRKVLDKQPDDVAALNNIALAYLAEKDKQALGMAEKANQLAPKNPSVTDTYGWILVNMGDVNKGTALLGQAAGQDHKNLEIRYHYAVGLQRSGQTAEAKSILEELLAQQQDFNGREDARRLLHGL